jgi:transcriptional regulator with XRE-family HTH domain
MKSQRKARSRRKVPPLCAAVHRTRQALNWTQEALAKQLSVAVMAVSKWERGIHEPSDPAALLFLRGLAADAGLDDERRLFDAALPPFEGVEDKSVDRRIMAAAPDQLVMRLNGIAEWHWMFALRHANAFLPEVRYAVEEALRPALETVRTIIQEQSPASGKLDTAFFTRLALRMDVLGAQKAFPHKFTNKENEQ